jgi:hypothetical protein
LRDVADAKKNTEYVCEVCGTRLVLVEGGEGWIENLVCCEIPMKAKAAKKKSKAKAKPKKKAKAKKRR